MKKIQMIAHNFVLSSSLIAAAFLAQACGSSTNNISPVTATQSGTTCTTGTCAGTTPTGSVYASCSYYGQMTTVTSGGSNVSVCKYVVAQSYFDIQAAAMTVSSTGSSGGTVTSLQLSQGDKLQVLSTGHYSPSGGVCHSSNGYGDISVLGNSDGKDPSTYNGYNVGLWYAFENSSGQYSTAVNATTQSGNINSYQTINVPMGSTTNSLVLGYNWGQSSIACGDMGAQYVITRCADASGNTYTCN